MAKRLIKLADFIQQKDNFYIVVKGYGCLLYWAELMLRVRPDCKVLRMYQILGENQLRMEASLK